MRKKTCELHEFRKKSKKKIRIIQIMLAALAQLSLAFARQRCKLAYTYKKFSIKFL